MLAEWHSSSFFPWLRSKTMWPKSLFYSNSNIFWCWINFEGATTCFIICRVSTYLTIADITVNMKTIHSDGLLINRDTVLGKKCWCWILKCNFSVLWAAQNNSVHLQCTPTDTRNLGGPWNHNNLDWLFFCNAQISTRCQQRDVLYSTGSLQA